MKKLFVTTLVLFSLTGLAQNKFSKRKGAPMAKTTVTTTPSNYYTFSTFTTSYQTFTGTIVSGGKKWDDLTDTIPLGFNFKLYNNQNDTIQLSGGSFFTFDDLINGNYLTAGSPMFEDLCDRAYDPNADSEGDPGGSSDISYTTTGTPGNKICKIQVSNAGFYGENDANGVSTSSVNFQIWLYETSNDIEFRYGNVSIQNPTLNLATPSGFVCGLVDSLDYNTSLAVKANMLTGIHSSPTVVGPNANFTDVITGNIQNGRVYKFSRNSITTSISKLPSLNHVALFPNPATDKLYVQNISNELINASIEFYDVTGLKVYSGELKNEIDLSSFSKGIYFVQIKTPNGEAGIINKLIITK